MIYKTLYNGDQVPVIGQGTWGLGGGMHADHSHDDRAREVIRSAIELGYTHIDTAEMYGGGHTEELVGEVIRSFPRDILFITSKVWQVTLEYQDTLSSLEGSLRRLGTEYLDLYLIHRPNRDIPLEETFRALNLLARQGKIRHLGVSNFNLEQLKRARYLSEMPLATNQVPYNLHNREYVTNGVLEYCQVNNILVTAYSPMERGHLANDPALQAIAERLSATPPQVALSWLLQQEGVIALPMSTRKEHLIENLGALDLKLSESDVKTLNEIELSPEHLWPE